MQRFLASWAVVAGCGAPAAGVDGGAAGALERGSLDRAGVLQCGLAAGDVEIEQTCAGVHVTSCTDLVDATLYLRGSPPVPTALSGTQADLPPPGALAAVRIRTVSGAEWFVLPPLACTDDDADGYPAPDDCDDADPAVHPGATELCNGVDDDCDASTSEDGTAASYSQGTWTDVTSRLTTPGFHYLLEWAGDELHLCRGTWTGVVTGRVQGTASVLGHPDAGSVVIDGGLGFEATNLVVLRDLTVTTGAVSTGAAETLLTDVDITGNSVTGLWVLSGSVTMVRGSVTDNVGVDVGGIVVRPGALLTLDGTLVARNQGTVGGVLLEGDSTHLYVWASTFEDNVGTGSARDVWAGETTFVTVAGSDFGPNADPLDTSAITLNTLQGGVSVDTEFGAGTFAGQPVGVGRDFDCHAVASNPSCVPLP